VIALGVATFLIGVGVGVVSTREDESATHAEAGPAQTTPSVEPPSPTASPSSLPPAEGTTGETGTTRATGPTGATGPIGSSVDNPVPAGESLELGDWTVAVVGFTRDADAAIQRENQFNDPPHAGQQYVMVTLRATYNGRGSEDPYFAMTWALISESGTLYEDATVVLPEDMIDVGNVPNGASGEGNVAFEVDRDEADSVVLYVEADTATFETEGAFFELR
jgi:hypothetical protein